MSTTTSLYAFLAAAHMITGTSIKKELSALTDTPI